MLRGCHPTSPAKTISRPATKWCFALTASRIGKPFNLMDQTPISTRLPPELLTPFDDSLSAVVIHGIDSTLPGEIVVKVPFTQLLSVIEVSGNFRGDNIRRLRNRPYASYLDLVTLPAKVASIPALLAHPAFCCRSHHCCVRIKSCALDGSKVALAHKKVSLRQIARRVRQHSAGFFAPAATAPMAQCGENFWC
jgi:hypothetical protein